MALFIRVAMAGLLLLSALPAQGQESVVRAQLVDVPRAQEVRFVWGDDRPQHVEITTSPDPQRRSQHRVYAGTAPESLHLEAGQYFVWAKGPPDQTVRVHVSR